jgi:bifunctional non-homologous end joining protein LigD
MAKLRTGGDGVQKRARDKRDDTVRSRAVLPSKRIGEHPDLFSTGPMPGWVEPCLAKLVDKVPAGERWVHEIKWDGYRLQAHVKAGSVTLYTRRGHDWTERFPTVAEALRSLPVTTAILDGEAVVEAENGLASFSALQAALGAREGPGHKAAHEAVLYAFDLLYLNGRDYRHESLEVRKAALASLLSILPVHNALRFSEHVDEDGDLVWRHACEMGLEGIIAKRRDRPYRSGRGEDWLKVKCVKRQEFVVGGYILLANRRRAVGALVLGYYEGDKLVYAGRVGTGFTGETAREIWAKLQPLRSETTRFAENLSVLDRRGALWVEPALVAEVEYRGWTSDGLVRHASFKGLREDKDPQDVVREDEKSFQATSATSPPSPPSRPSRERSRREPGSRLGIPKQNIQTLYPDAVVPSAEQLGDYWRSVGADALKHLGRRPLKVVRREKGITFMHQGPLPPVPEAVHQLRIRKRKGEEGVRLWVDSVEGLLGLTEMGVVEIHPWGALVDDVEHPDMLVLDIDPGEGVEWSFVVETALKLRHTFRSEGLSPWPKLSGSKGIHVMVPVAPDLDWDEAREYCRALAERVAATAPDQYTTSARADRTGRIFLDYLRNSPSITAIGAYSPRAKAGFPVAMQVSWKDVERGTRPDAFTMRSLLQKRQKRRAGR